MRIDQVLGLIMSHKEDFVTEFLLKPITEWI